jgi:PAS domain S-box-containing protein
LTRTPPAWEEGNGLGLDPAHARLALETAGIGLWEWDIASDQVTWSPYLSNILGLPETLLSGERDFLNLRIHPDDQVAARQAIEDHIEDARPYDVEYRLRHEDGHYITVRSRGQAQRNAQGNIARMAGSLVDVTEERRSQAELKRIGLRSRLAVEAAELATWEMDLVAQTARMDARLCHLLGRPELIDTPIPSVSMLEFTAPEDRDIVRDLFAALIKGKSEFVRNKHRIMNRDGERIWIYAHVGVAERSKEGRSLRLVGVTQDLSEHKAIELRLRQAKERAEAANAAKSSFLATMSHEIRTPLNGMLGVAQLLQLSDLSEQQKRYVDTLQSSGRILTGVIEDILDISRIEAGKLRLQPEQVETQSWFDECIAPHAAAASEKGLKLVAAVCQRAARPRRFDPTRTAQILGNLVSNAIKFTRAGKVEVNATIAGTDRLRFEVRDTGPGIAEDMQALIFDRFSQADMSLSREHGGSGLGLAIAQELVILAHGHIGVSSELGTGSTFWFEVPAPASFDDVTGPHEDSASNELGTLKALIIEDNIVNRDMLTAMLTEHGINVEAVANGQAGLDKLRDHAVDVILLDLHMPDIGGFELLDRIRAGEAGRADIPIYLVSADATPEARDQAASHGANGFFRKPVDMVGLIAALSDIAANKAET